jgi:hypothetical protein
MNNTFKSLFRQKRDFFLKIGGVKLTETKKKVKHPEINVGDESFLRVPIKTHVILKKMFY